MITVNITTTVSHRNKDLIQDLQKCDIFSIILLFFEYRFSPIIISTNMFALTNNIGYNLKDKNKAFAIL